KAWVVIKLILSEEGYVINKNKEMLSGPRSKREITGLVVTPKLGIGQRKYNMYRNKIFHLCHKNDNESILIIQGILAYIKGVDQDRYSKLKKYYDALKTKEVTE
ncbi:RNA-directed DNA polymerase, partial [Salmonella enterica]|nr:RNA-directed DNA polymerase [Salmonella enterica]EDL8055872.1 RNA-directed DNA polymerase [Salmonella enterica subsp. enterica serovar Newport]